MTRVLRVADAAMDRFDNGWRTGDWQPFLAMLTDDFSFWFPRDPARGRFERRQGLLRVRHRGLLRHHDNRISALHEYWGNARPATDGAVGAPQTGQPRHPLCRGP